MSRFTRFILTLAVISIVSFVEIFAAVAPSSQARYISFSNLTANSVDITMVRGNGNNRIVVVSTTAITDTATFGVDYTDQGGSFTDGVSIITGSDDRVVDVLSGSQWQSTISNLSGGQTYYVKVFEYNKDGANPITAYNQGTGSNNPRSFSTPIVVNAPINLALVNPATATTADLEWDDGNTSPEADGYIFTLYVETAGEGAGNGTYVGPDVTVSPFDELDLGNTTNFELTDLVGLSDYKFEVMAYIGSTNSDPSTFEFFTPLDNTPPQVSTITLTGETNNGGGLDNVIFEDDNGQDLTFTVTFNEAMKTWLTPTFSFNTPSPQGMSYVTGFWNNEGTVFTATINFDGADQESLDINITIGNAEDLAGNLISAGTPTASDVFSIDNISPSIDFIDYPGDACNKVGDEVEADITLTEVGYGTYDANDVVVKLINNTTSQEHIMTWSSFDATGATASNFTYTFQAGDDEGQYSIDVSTSDDAGNGPVTDNNPNGPTFDETAPVISNLLITGEDGTCLSDNDGDVLEFTFDVVEEGCGTFDENDVTVTIEGSGEDTPTNILNFVSHVGNTFTYTLNIDEADNDGNWNIIVDATDDAGNDAIQLDPEGAEYIVDNTAPVFTAASVTAACENGGDIVTLTFSVTEDGCGTFDGTNLLVGDDVETEQAWTYVSGTGVGPYTYTLALVASDPDGLVTVSINGTDAAGNIGLENTDATFTIDNTAPVFSGVSMNTTCENGGNTVTLTFTATEDGCGTFNQDDIVITDDVTTATNTWTYSGGGPGTGIYTYTLPLVSGDPSGLVTVSIDATDDAGNAATTNTEATFTIDNVAPVISNVAVDKTCLNGGTTVTLTFDVAEAGCGVFDNSLITISDNATTANNWTYSSGAGAGTYTYTLLIAGGDADNTSVNVTVDADDAAGNSATPVTNTGAFAIDNTIPTVSIVDPEPSAEVNSSKVINFDADDGTGCGTMTTEASVDAGANWTEITDGDNTLGDIPQFGPLGDGAFTLSLRTTDGAGNVSSPVTTVALTKDATPPTVTGVTPSDQEISITDVGGALFIDIDFNEDMDQSEPNEPVVTITPNNSLPTTNTSGSWFNSTRYTAIFSVIDVSNPEALQDLDVTVSGARDDTEDTGNEMLEDNTTGADNFSIDTEAPTISFDGTSPEADDCVRGIETVEFTAADVSAFSGLDEVRAKIGAGAYETVTSGFALSSLTDWAGTAQGTFTLYLLALDDFGNETVVSRDLNKDDIAPIISSVIITPTCYKSGQEISITFDVTEGGCGTFDENDIEFTADDGLGGPSSLITFTVTEDGGSPSGSLHSFTATYTVQGSDAEGLYTYSITATDDAGNVDSDSGEDDFAIDNTGPVLSNLVVTPAAAGGTTLSVNVEFDVLSSGCSSFDASTVVYTVTGPGTLANSITTPPVDQDGTTWRSTLAISNADVTGNYHISLVAADELGNPSNTLNPAGVELVIDNTPPQVSSVTTSHTPAGPFPTAPVLNRADDDGIAPEFYIDVVYNEPLDATQTIPTLEFHISGKNPTTSGALTLGTPSRPNSSTLRYPFDLDNSTNLDMRSIGVRINGARDVAGNVQTTANTKGSLFGIDFETPQLVSVTPTPTFVVDGSSQLGLLFSFTEDMKTNVKPSVSFDAGNGPDNDSLALILTYIDSISIWNSATLFTAKFDVDGSHPLDSDPIAVGLSNATDLAGNPFPGSNESEVFQVDTKEPTCDSLITTPTDPIVNLLDLDFDVTIYMDQRLDNTVTPTISFATSSAFTISGGTYSITNDTNDTYSFTVTHNGTTEEEHEEIMSVTGFKDLSGNVQVIACVDTFDVDTDRPDVLSVTVSDDKICRDDDESDEVITITFDEEMNPAVLPVITFDADISASGDGILLFPSGVWSAGNTVYTVTYSIDAFDEYTINDVDVIINDAEDLLGNVMLPDTTFNLIDVDTELPTVTGIAFNPIPTNSFGVNRSNIGANGFNVVVTYDEAMDGLSTPTITFEDLSQVSTGTVAAALTAGTGSWTSSTVFTKQYTVNDASVELDLVTADVSGATDACGNTQNLFDGSFEEVDFAIDLIAPTCVGLDREYSTVYEGQLVQELFVDFSEPMQNTINPEFNFSSTNFTVGSGTWDESDEFSVFVTHNGTEEEIPIEIVTLNLVSTQPIDLAGNPMLAAACSTSFEIDTRKPLVSSVSFSPAKIIASTSSFFVTVVFDEDMENAPNPTITFNETLTGLLNYVGYTTPNDTTFVYEYGVTDVDLEVMDIDIDIAIGQDVAGNVMLTHTSTESFDIDQVEPTVTSVTFSSHPGWINRTDIGNGNFTVTVVYDEEMNDLVAPTIDLEPNEIGPIVLDNALVFASGAWSDGSNTNDTYTATYNVIDVAYANESLGANIDNAQDACGNTQEDYDTDSEDDGTIDIDLVNPTVSFSGNTPLAESCVNGTESIDFTANDVNFFDEVQGRINGGSFAACTTGVLINELNGWTGTDGSITIELKALDLAGNETIIDEEFTVDVTAPVISNVQFTNTCVTTGDVVTLTFDVVEDGCATFDSDDITITEFENGFVADGGNPTGTGTYTFTLLINGDDTEGAKDVAIYATDGVGNESLTTTTNGAFTVDKTAPSYSLEDSPESTCVNNNTTLEWAIQSDDAGCGDYDENNIIATADVGAVTVTNLIFDIYTITIDLSGTDFEDDGTYDIAIEMTDAAGNVRNETIEDAFTIDNTAPTVTLISVDETCMNTADDLVFTFEAYDDGCGTFDINDITVTTGLVDTNPNIVLNSGTGTSGDPYNYTFTYDVSYAALGDDDGDYDITIDATDDAGNINNFDPAGSEFSVDNTIIPPGLFTYTTPTCVTDGDSITIRFEAYDDGCGTFDETNFSYNSYKAPGFVTQLTDPGTLTILSGAGISFDPYIMQLSFDISDADSDGDYNISVGFTDAAGNGASRWTNNDNVYTIDNTAPTLASLTLTSDECVNDGNDKITFTFTGYDDGCGTFDEGDLTVTSTSSENPQFVSKTGSGTSGSPYVFTYSLDISDTDGDYDITVNATDSKGNNSTPLTGVGVFTVDNTAPVVAFSDPAGGETVNASKVLDFTATDGGCGIVSTEVSVDNTNWTVATSGITDLGDITEFGGLGDVGFTLYIRSTDVAGNIGTSSLSLTKDATAPTVTLVTASDLIISTADDGNSFTVEVNFSEVMDQTANPTVTLTTNGTVATSNTGGSWNTGTQFTATFGNIDGASNEEIADLDVTVSGAKDDTEDIGNTMVLQTLTNVFSIDTKAPTITVASIKSSNSLNNQYARVGNDIILTITPSEELDGGAFTGTIAGYTISSVSDKYSSNGTYELTVSTDPGVPAGIVTFSIDYKDINGNSGATLTSITDGSSVTVDKIAPVGTIALAGGQADPTSDSPINFALTFSEDVYGLTDGDIDVTGSANPTTAVVTGSGDTYNVAVSGMTGTGTVVITLVTGKVTDIASNDNTTTTNADNSVQYNVSGATVVTIGAGVEPSTISSLIDTQGEAVLNFDFDVIDDNGTGVDLLATLITDISISQGTGNDFADWTTIIAGAELTDGSNTVSGTVGATTIAFTGLAHGAGQIGEVKDDSTKTYSLKVWLSSTPSDVIDNLNLAFKVNRGSFNVNGSGSSFASGAGADFESDSTNNEIEVIATKLLFTTTPTSTVVNTNTTFVVEATDANNNRDVNNGSTLASFLANQSTITSGNTGSLSNGILTLNAVQFSTAFANDYVTATAVGLSNGVSSTFNIKPSAITNLTITPNSTEFYISWSNPSGNNTLILAKKAVTSYTYTDEVGMDNETAWSANANYNSSPTPSDGSASVIYAGSDSSVTMTGLISGRNLYAVTAYAYAGTLNTATQNFNTNETSISKKTLPKEADYSDAINKGLRLGIDNITPQPANLNNLVSLQVETIEDMPLTLELYDSKGQLMMTLFEGKDFSAGETPFEFNLANTVSSGQHFLRLTGNGHVVIAPLMIVK